MEEGVSREDPGKLCSCNLDSESAAWCEKDFKKKLLTVDSQKEVGTKDLIIQTSGRKTRLKDGFGSWIGNPVLRTAEKETVALKSGVSGRQNKLEPYWRDRRSSNVFHFKHYSDSIDYIEHYRTQHTLQPSSAYQNSTSRARSSFYPLPQYVTHYNPPSVTIRASGISETCNSTKYKLDECPPPVISSAAAKLSYKHRTPSNPTKDSDSGDSVDSTKCNSPSQVTYIKPYTGRRTDPNAPNGIGVNLTPTKPTSAPRNLPGAPYFNSYLRKAGTNQHVEKAPPPPPPIVYGGVHIPAHDLVVPQNDVTNLDARVPLISNSQDFHQLTTSARDTSKPISLSDVPAKSLMVALQAELEKSLMTSSSTEEEGTKSRSLFENPARKTSLDSGRSGRTNKHVKLFENKSDYKISEANLKQICNNSSLSSNDIVESRATCERLKRLLGDTQHGSHPSLWKPEKRLEECLKNAKRNLLQQTGKNHPGRVQEPGKVTITANEFSINRKTKTERFSSSANRWHHKPVARSGKPYTVTFTDLQTVSVSPSTVRSYSVFQS